MHSREIVPVVLALAAGAIGFATTLQVRKSSDEDAARAHLEEIARAQEKLLARTGEYGTLAALGAAGLIDRELASGTRDGYDFRVEPSRLYPWNYWLASATPVAPGVSGDRTFLRNHAGHAVATTRNVEFDDVRCQVREPSSKRLPRDPMGFPLAPCYGNGERCFDTNMAGVIFYTTGAQLSLDTSTCALPANVIVIGE